METEKTCPICGTPINDPTHPNKIYCSRECSVIGRHADKEAEAYERVKQYLNSVGSFRLLDVLPAHLSRPGGTDNSITARGARSWQGKRFILLVVDDRQQPEEENEKFYPKPQARRKNISECGGDWVHGTYKKESPFR